MAGVTTYTDAIASAICERIGDGESLRSICASEDMPSKSTVFKWLAENKAFSDQYARARESQADSMADDIVSIADEPGDPNDKRVRIDARKWVASKLRAKVYGDKVTQEHTGANGGPLNISVSYVGVTGGVPVPSPAQS